MSWRKSKDLPHLNAEADEQPLRATLFSVDQLARHAKVFATSHRLASGAAPDKLIPRLDENERLLTHTYDVVSAAVKRNRRIAPAGEWLLDNFYLIEEQIRTARRHLPRSYSRALPRLASGPSAHYPRVYSIALELITHVDGRVDAIGLDGFIAAYQSVVPLKLGELWAVPIMLRLALIENLRRVAVRIASERRDRDIAGDWAERMVEVVEKNPTDLILVMADMARAKPSLSGAFLAEMTRHLQGQSPHFAFAHSWLEHRLSEQGLTLEQLVVAEGRAQAADQVSIGNSINSLRFLTFNDWRDFVEKHSLVERILREDPARVYRDMDFATRDRYRHEVEEIARRSPLSEFDVARQAIQLARTTAEHGPEGKPDGRSATRQQHVGYYLIDDGRAALEQSASFRLPLHKLAARIGGRYPLLCYLAGVLLVTAAAAVVFLLWAGHLRVAPGVQALLLAPVMICAAHLGVSLVNWLATLFVPPRPLPRMDFKEGIPPEERTLVVVPTMLTRPETVEDLLEGLEVRYLANRDGNISFALLTDLADAPQEVLPQDEELVRLASEGIERLNQKHLTPPSANGDASARGGDIFFLFHRPRRWNAQEGVWMGYERKRGKLAELNAFLRGNSQRFARIVGDTTELAQVRYVITLDTDTQLPREAARRMVGAMAHPLNRPVLDAASRSVVAGYGILQPRVGVSLPSAQRSWFVRLVAGDAGMDPYTRVVSDVYQDLFGEGSFIGKGIYDVDAFERCCGDFPENAILSHDLLESVHARSALLSDVELYEQHPARYPTDVSRRHRWVRGDWQIALWLLPWAPGRTTRRLGNPLSGLSRWKIFDNLRRSLTPAALLAVLLGAWLLLPPPLVVAGTFFVVAAVGAAPLLAGVADLLRKPAELPVRAHLRGAGRALGKHLGQLGLTLVLLPYEALVNLDAVVRTLWRMLWSKKKLLQWTTSSDAEQSDRAGLFGFVRTMWIAPALAIAALLLIVQYREDFLAIAAPFLGLWVLSPLLAWWLSRPLTAPPPRLSEPQRVFLEKLTRRTWRFFEVFVSADESWLPPDNYQERPARIASRTSPTNIGVAILGNLSAYDFGYCSAGALLERTQNTLGTLARMERYRGHFYNWYDTRSLKPLPPRYISTVDSGNLLGHLLVLRGGLLEMIQKPVLPARMFGGLRDTARVLLDVAQGLGQTSAQEGARLASRELLRQIERVEEALGTPPRTLSDAVLALDRLVVVAGEIRAAAEPDGELQWWAAALERSCVDHRDDLRQFAPWFALPAIPDQAWRSGAAAQTLKDLMSLLQQDLSLSAIAALAETALPLLDKLAVASAAGVSAAWLESARAAIGASSRRAADRMKALERLAQQCQELADMDFVFLFDKRHGLFAIGYNADEQRRDDSFYDLLASEARLASFLAIAQDQLGQEHWFALGRLLTATGGAPTLLSWSGSMFEYLMPLLVMPTYPNTLLDQTYAAMVRRQIQYGGQRGVPWGMSESGYNTVDVHMNYQYRAFGVPGLGLKRGLAEDLVVAPYASLLALMVAPEAACKNLERLSAEGHAGAYGLYEAIDYTPARVPRGATSVTVRQFMAHHQGMGLLALAYVLLDKPMQRRFLADPMLRAAELLLQERVPKSSPPVFPHVSEARATQTVSAEVEGTMRVFTDPGGAGPEVNLLSNGRYHAVVTSAGGGYSRWHDFAVTRWREDPTRDCWGSFCYLRDLESGNFWSTAWHPTLKTPRRYQAIFTQGRAEFRCRFEKIDTHAEISISPEDDVELRRITITNRSDSPRTIEVTTYAEVVLAPQAHDLAHPAFSNLFVQTEIIRDRQAIFCTRRPRSAGERPPWLVHKMTVRNATLEPASFETDRLRFIGRGRTLDAPTAMDEGAQLSNSQGPVLDPIVSIRQVIRLPPNATVKVDLVMGVGESRDVVAGLMDKYHDLRLADRVFELAWTHSHILLQQLNATETQAQTYARLAGSVIYATSLRRAKASVLMRNRRGQSGLWGYGISGDLPIVLVRIRDRTRIELVRQAVQAHAYWRLRGLSVDLVIWNEDDSVYRQTMQDTIMGLLAASPEAALLDKPGGVFVRRGEQMSEEDRALLQTVARVVLVDDAGTFLEQVERRGRAETNVPALKPLRRPPEATALEVPRRDLAFFNGTGGFSHDGREYITIVAPGQATPAPWVNVIANPSFGAVVSESGGGYTWAENSHEFRLTPWHNDPVSDTAGEALYLRDEETGRFWSPTPLPARGHNSYIARHGFGYSIFEYAEDGIITELSFFVAMDAPVKFVRLKIANRSGRPRHLSTTAYWEWVLGELRAKSLQHVITELDPLSGALLTRNVYNSEFADRVVFVDCSEPTRTMTADRTEFLGRNGAPANPAAMRRTRLSGRVGAGLDPCSALQVSFSLEEGQDKDVVFLVGAAQGEEQARHLIQRFRGTAAAQEALEGVWNYWNRCLGVVYLETPDAAVNFLANGWLLYQVLACRMWARTGFYQSGGAFGFRDQLQDAMALVHAEPALLREHLLRAAARQFREGDVQHWWHPPAGRGVRTHFSDDYLWLPYATCRYVAATGDTGVLEERVFFLAGRPVRPEEDAYYDLPSVSTDIGTLYEHCVRALDNGLRFGAHGLPLMGGGDWNDGMNLVGAEGKGESVWLAFFLYDVLQQFAELARRRDDPVADRYTTEADKLRTNLEEHAWDGAWYRRAWFDDGTPLGSSANEECRIDSISQSWSILSGAGARERALTAMESVDRLLVRRDTRLIQLLDPPFDRSALDPGYIKGYVPGVRENGGQYTHSAIWTVMAFAALGDSQRAWELFTLINPVLHGATAGDAALYRVEPYVVAADVYAVPPHTGRGGWTWYTGSAGWMYRLITESLLGLHLEVDMLHFRPCLPADWSSFKVHYRYRETFYHITMHNSAAGVTVNRVVVDGREQPERHVRLIDDRHDHRVEIHIC